MILNEVGYFILIWKYVQEYTELNKQVAEYNMPIYLYDLICVNENKCNYFWRNAWETINSENSWWGKMGFYFLPLDSIWIPSQ